MFIHVAAAAVLLLQTAGAAKPAAPKPAATKPAAAKPAAAKSAAVKPAATDIAVTLTYKGKGTVDAQHHLVAWLFASPDVTSNSRPVDTVSTAKNGETITFKNVPAGPLYIFTVFDDKGGYDGRSGPPAPGTPSSLYKKQPKGPATPVKPGELVTLTFTDAERWNK